MYLLILLAKSKSKKGSGDRSFFWYLEEIETSIEVVETRLYNEVYNSQFKESAMSDKYNIPDSVMDEVAGFAKKNSVTKVILFGSRAKGTNGERSDIDIAVAGGDFEGFYWDIKEKINSLLSFDIVEFDKTISEELRKEIEKDGVVIYEESR